MIISRYVSLTFHVLYTYTLRFVASANVLLNNGIMIIEYSQHCN